MIGKLQQLKDYFTGRVRAYRMVFDPKNQYTETVLKDLAQFCRAHEPTFHADPRIHAVMEGRREVWLRIQQNLNLSIEEVYQLHKIKNVEIKGDNS